MSSHTQPNRTNAEDPFDSLLTLEDTLYTSAYAQGVQDGARAGRIEGRIFGLEKGFEKFAAMGVLHGRACVWGSRLPLTSLPAAEESTKRPVAEQSGLGNGVAIGGLRGDADVKYEYDTGLADALSSTSNSQPLVAPFSSGATTATEKKNEEHKSTILPPLPENARLARNIHLLHGLTDPLTFSTSNTEDDVADFDDRFKRASAKTKIIERTIGEHGVSAEATAVDEPQDFTNTGDRADSPGVSSSGRSKSPKKVGRSVKLSEGKSQKKTQGDSMEDFGGSRLLR
jgi:hypothetical protein